MKFNSLVETNVIYTQEDFIRVIKSIKLATSKAVAAGNGQDDVVVAANFGRKAISDLMTTCKVI